MTQSIVDMLIGPVAFLLFAGIFYLIIYWRIKKYKCYG